jgi:hypothetical protein
LRRKGAWLILLAVRVRESYAARTQPVELRGIL